MPWFALSPKLTHRLDRPDRIERPIPQSWKMPKRSRCQLNCGGRHPMVRSECRFRMGSCAICFAARDANAFCAGAQWLATGATGGVIEGSGLLPCVRRLEPTGQIQILNTSFGSRNESAPSTRGTKSHPAAQALMAAPSHWEEALADNEILQNGLTVGTLNSARNSSLYLGAFVSIRPRLRRCTSASSIQLCVKRSIRSATPAKFRPRLGPTQDRQ